MKKSLRIQTEMRFINNRERFTIADLQAEFDISRATAIRDLQEIETLGLPLTSQPGHGGGYAVLRNQTLVQVQFNQSELAALFTAMQASTNTQLPFLKSRQAIVEKLLSQASPAQRAQLLALRQILIFENTNPDDPDLLELTDHAPDQLAPLIELATTTPNLTFNYTKPNNTVTTRHVYLLHIYQRQARWYLEGLDRDRHAKRLFRVDHITQLVADDDAEPLTKQTIAEWTRDVAFNVDLTLDTTAIQRFRRWHQPGRRLQFLDPYQQQARLQDTVNVANPDAVAMYADWVLFLGDGVNAVQLPEVVRAQLRRKLARWR